MHNYSRPLPRAKNDEPRGLTTWEDDVEIVKSILGAVVLHWYLYRQEAGDMGPSTTL